MKTMYVYFQQHTDISTTPYIGRQSRLFPSNYRTKLPPIACRVWTGSSTGQFRYFLSAYKLHLFIHKGFLSKMWSDIKQACVRNSEMNFARAQVSGSDVERKEIMHFSQ